MPVPMFSHSKIRPLRQAKSLNQSDIAAELGISRPTYALIEQGTKEPTLSQLYTLARLLGVEPNYLCTNLPATGTTVADYAKFKEVVAVCTIRGASDTGITKTKLSLLVYLADFAWLHQTSHSMTGATYRHTPHGPVADDFLRALNELYEAQGLAIEPKGTTLVIRPIESRPTELLRQKELLLIEHICTKWRPHSTEALVAFVAQQLSPKDPKPGEPIAYESVLGKTAVRPY